MTDVCRFNFVFSCRRRTIGFNTSAVKRAAINGIDIGNKKNSNAMRTTNVIIMVH